jgi:hypothetical protein
MEVPVPIVPRVLLPSFIAATVVLSGAAFAADNTSTANPGPNPKTQGAESAPAASDQSEGAVSNPGTARNTGLKDKSPNTKTGGAESAPPNNGNR